MNRWRHDNEAIIKKKNFKYVQNEISYKTYISVFLIFKI